MTNEKKTATDLPQTMEVVPTVKVKYLNAVRKAVGLQINPGTAEVEWIYGQTLDPYGDDTNLPEACQQVGREYFARSPGGDVRINFGDSLSSPIIESDPWLPLESLENEHAHFSRR
jgi:hypothetical protein